MTLYNLSLMYILAILFCCVNLGHCEFVKNYKFQCSKKIVLCGDDNFTSNIIKDFQTDCEGTGLNMAKVLQYPDCVDSYQKYDTKCKFPVQEIRQLADPVDKYKEMCTGDVNKR